MGIKIDKSFENSLMDCAIVDTSPSEASFDSALAETALSWIAHSHITTPVTTSKDIASYIKYLDAKLSAVRKTATFWDAYNIRESASTVDEFAQKYAALPNNSSLVINTGTLNIGKKTYSRGDIVIKDNYGNEVDVKNNLSGVYIPDKVENLDNGNLQINFRYSSNKSLGDPKIEFTPTTPNEGTIYSEIIESTAFANGRVSRDAREFNGKPVIPFWECREYDPNTKVIKDKIFDLIQVKLEKDELNNDKIVFTALNKNIPFILLIK